LRELRDVDAVPLLEMVNALLEVADALPQPLDGGLLLLDLEPLDAGFAAVARREVHEQLMAPEQGRRNDGAESPGTKVNVLHDVSLCVNFARVAR
jgi:hypothetical protein